MKIRNLPDDCLELSESKPLVRWACAAFAVLLPALVLCGAWLEGWPGWERVLGAGVGAVATALVAAVLQDWRFLFDPRRRTLTWRRRNWFRDRRGVMLFADIQDVVVSARLETDSEFPSQSRWLYSLTLATRAGPFQLTQTSSSAPSTSCCPTARRCGRMRRAGCTSSSVRTRSATPRCPTKRRWQSYCPWARSWRPSRCCASGRGWVWQKRRRGWSR